MTSKHKKSLMPLIEALEECAELVDDEFNRVRDAQHAEDSCTSSTQQCGGLSDKDQPIRTVHHFACTGGTLIAKCLASMPNTQVLSEVEPHSRMNSELKFTPTDVVALLNASSRRPSNDLTSTVFLSALKAIYEDCQAKGLHLILRDHSHSKFCFRTIDRSSPSLRDIVAQQFDTLSIVTVRHPLDSYLSLVSNGWLHFMPQSIDEYSKRYIKFLNSFADSRIFKYESLVEDSGRFMQQVCEELQLSYFADFASVFHVHKLSGDSGRRADTIRKHERREISADLMREIENSPNFVELCQMLDYSISE